MSSEFSIRRAVRRLFAFSLVSLFFGPALPANGQTGENRPKSGSMRLSESRGVSTATAKNAVTSPAPKADPKTDAESSSIGFFGDTRKFTRLGGWGSFGNAMGEFGFAKSTLIAMPPVQEELKLTDEQKKKLRELQETMRKKGEEMGKSMREKAGDDPLKAAENLPIASRVMQFTSMIGQFGSLARENEANLGRILNASQRKRLNQIALQMEGISALTRPEIVEALGLFEEDQQAIQQVLTQSRTMQMTTWIGSMMAMRPARRPSPDSNTKNEPTPPGDPKTKPTPTTSPNNDPAAPGAEPDPKARAEREKAMRKRFETMRDQTDRIQDRAVREISNILSKAQRAKFEILLGPPFDPKKINTLGQPPRRDGSPPPEKASDPPNSRKS